MLNKQNMTIKQILNNSVIKNNLVVNGWVKNKRGSKNVTFISLNDGSTIKNLQIVLETQRFCEETVKNITTGCCISVEGILSTSKGSGQAVELTANNVVIIGKADSTDYPLQPKKHSLEFLREKAHLRFRTNTFSAVFRIRHALSYSIHKFFHEKGFLIYTPLLLHQPMLRELEKHFKLQH